MNGWAQKMELTSAVIALDNHKNLEDAKKYIDIANEKLQAGASFKKAKMLSKFHHYMGLVYLKTFQSNPAKLSDGSISFSDLDIATQSFLVDASLNANYSKKSIAQLPVCAFLYQDGAYKDYESQKYELALNKFINAIEINSSKSINKIDTFNMYNAALMAYQAGDYAQSAEWSNQLIKIDSNDSRFHLRLINAYSELGDLELQLEAIKNGRKNVPQSKDIIFAEVNYYLSSGDNKLLLSSLDEAVKSDASNPILHLVLGNTYNQLGDFDKAKESFKKAIALDSSYFDAYNNLASLYLDQTSDLIEKKNALTYKQKKQFENYKNQINDLYALALPYLEMCHQLDSENIGVISALKEIYYKLDNSKKSIEMKKLEDALKSN